MVPARRLRGMAFCILALGAAAAAGGSVPGVEERVRRVEALLDAARFRDAAREAPNVRHEVLAMPPTAASRRLLVRTEIAAGTAALALRQENAARSCFLRALQLDPALALAANTPPKVRRALDSAREGN